MTHTFWCICKLELVYNRHPFFFVSQTKLEIADGITETIKRMFWFEVRDALQGELCCIPQCSAGEVTVIRSLWAEETGKMWKTGPFYVLISRAALICESGSEELSSQRYYVWLWAALIPHLSLFHDLMQSRTKCHIQFTDESLSNCLLWKSWTKLKACFNPEPSGLWALKTVKQKRLQHSKDNSMIKTAIR